MVYTDVIRSSSIMLLLYRKISYALMELARLLFKHEMLMAV